MSALMYIYIGVSLVCILWLLAALLMGIEHGFDHDVAGDSGDMSDGPSWLSTRVILGAGAGFGLFGLAGFWFSLPELLTLIPAFVGLFLIAHVVRNWIIIPLMKWQSNSLLSRTDYIGKQGVVWQVGIRPDSSGRVQFEDSSGTSRVEEAVSEDPTLELPIGTSVLIRNIEDSHLVVVPFPFQSPLEKGN